MTIFFLDSIFEIYNQIQTQILEKIFINNYEVVSKKFVTIYIKLFE